MRTGRSLTVSWSLLPGRVSALGVGGVCSWWRLLPGGVCSGWCLLPGGMSALGGVCSQGCLLWGVSAPEGCLLPGGVSALGVSAPGECLFLGDCGIPACTEADTPPVNRMTNRCKNITLATTSLRPVKKDPNCSIVTSFTNHYFHYFGFSNLPTPSRNRRFLSHTLAITHAY